MRPFTSPPNRAIGAKALVFGRSVIAWIPFALWVLLTFRLLIAVNGDDSIRWPALIFAAGCFTVGLILNQPLMAWLIATPFVATCAFFGLLPVLEPLVLGFCCLSVGALLRGKFFRPAGLPRHVLWLDGVASWIAVGLVWHWRDLGGSTVASTLWSQAVFGFDDPLFLLTDTHLWLTAWILYRLWLPPVGLNRRLDTQDEILWRWSRRWLSVVARCFSPRFDFHLGSRRGLEHRATPRANAFKTLELAPSDSSPIDGLRPTKWPHSFRSAVAWMGIWTVVIGFAWLAQRRYLLPDLYIGFVSFGPFEDIHAFGSVIGTLFVGTLCRIRTNRSEWTASLVMVGASLLVASSYSRATWLWVGIGIVVVIFLRCSRRVSGALAIIGAGLIVTLYCVAPKLRALNHPYADRVAALVQVERWSQQDAPRLHYYQRSIGLIRDRPWFGYGTGSSRRITGDFVHNFLLQTATESGVPAAVFLLVGLAGAMLPSARALRRNIGSVETKALLAAALTYLGTQLTANAINIYSTQVFFFWPLLAMLYLSAQRDLNSNGRAVRLVLNGRR